MCGTLLLDMCSLFLELPFKLSCCSPQCCVLGGDSCSCNNGGLSITHANHGNSVHQRTITAQNTKPTNQQRSQDSPDPNQKRCRACTFNFIHSIGTIPIKVQQSDRYTLRSMEDNKVSIGVTLHSCIVRCICHYRVRYHTPSVQWKAMHLTFNISEKRYVNVILSHTVH